MADTGLLAAPTAAAAARHGKVQTPPLGVYSSAEDCTDSEAEADRTRDDEDDDHGRRLQQQQQQQPVCLTAAVRSNAVTNNNNNNIINNCNNNNNNSTRNKRKNFQPRNISYTQETAEDGSAENGNRGAAGVEDSDATNSDSAAAAAAVLDLSACTGSTVAKRPRVDDGSAPMDLTCAVQPAVSLPVSYVTADKRSASVSASANAAAAAAAAAQGVQHLLAAAAAAATGHHPHQQHQPHDPSSDLKEYAQNTVRELLEIYGLNTDVADAITNNVPMVNFSTGKCDRILIYLQKRYNVVLRIFDH